MSGPVDVLAVMGSEIRSLPEMAAAIRFAGAKYGWGIDESEAVRRMEEALAAVAELIEAADQAHEFLCEKTPATATAYRLRKALARVRGAA